jgi:hypothetical protein
MHPSAINSLLDLPPCSFLCPDEEHHWNPAKSDELSIRCHGKLGYVVSARATDHVFMTLPILSTFLGHVHVSDTYWYFTAHPELMGLAMRRLEKRWEGRA